MNFRDQIRGRITFGQGFGAGGFPVAFNVDPDQLQDRTIRPESPVGKGPHGELDTFEPDRFEIEIVEGRTDAKYSWKRVHCSHEATRDDVNGGGTHDSGSYALEINGDESVEVGTRHFARFARFGTHLLFSVRGGGTGERGRWVKVTDTDGGGDPAGVAVPTGPDGYCFGILRQRVTDDVGYEDSETDILIEKGPQPAGEIVLLTGWVYWATYAGVVTVEGEGEDPDVDYPLYHVGQPHGRIQEEICDDEDPGNPQYDDYYAIGLFKRVDQPQDGGAELSLDFSDAGNTQYIGAL